MAKPVLDSSTISDSFEPFGHFADTGSGVRNKTTISDTGYRLKYLCG